MLPYTWQEGTYKKLYETHFPSKLPEYLSLGMPVVVIGPDYATGVIWALENSDSVIAISERNEEHWQNELTKLKNDGYFRVELGRKALEKKNQFFSPEVIQKDFLNFINTFS